MRRSYQPRKAVHRIPDRAGRPVVLQLRAAASVISIAALLSLLGCAGPASSESTADMFEYHKPPQSPPVITVQGHELTPAAYQWRKGGTWSENTPTDNRPATNTVDFGESVTVTSASTPPTVVRILEFDTAEPQELSRRDLGQPIECGKSARCALQRSDTAFAIVIRSIPSSVKLVTISAEYATFEAEDRAEGVESYTVSWVLERKRSGPRGERPPSASPAGMLTSDEGRRR